MSLPTNERLGELYAALAGAVTTEDIEQMLRRAGKAPGGQELLDVRHQLRQLLREKAEMLG